ncbi:TonB-dependent hemoglobin/transferrin/lactoferrin family receptor [Sediminicoccus sp. KRV36]|uniref:TonB-dependent hemoglobin/transferrin/lactoferrin family receptor n=1 Tax=Sediminicoccus sp. KRV36 TaxID=3133721 RepID=UPI00200EBB80|nr:TonB-dependent hemoglobin/transferrin/lactoferrin family receptor [Sediminicoccus rosea]UPY38788.1 TonB-dependent hemoglobin/transferrin/lactoferrin family receptor [Sediminicoccus rosea]
MFRLPSVLAWSKALALSTALISPGLIFPGLVSRALAQTPATQPAATPLDAVTTTATRTPQVAGDSAVSISVIQREQIMLQQARSPVELLRDIPGVEISGAPRTTALQPTIRGLGDERIVLRVDGVRNNFNAGHRGRTFIDPELLRQVEVLRGPASSLYGSGAIGGVITFRTLEPEDVIRAGNPVGGFLSTGYQSQGAGARGLGVMAARAGDFSTLAAASGFRNGQFRDGEDRIIRFSGDSVSSLLGKLNWTPGFHRLQLNASRFEDHHQIPIAANTATTTGIAERTTLQESVSFRYGYANPALPLLEPSFTIYNNRVELNEARIAAPYAQDRTRLNTMGLDAQNISRFSLFGAERHTLVAGVEYYRDEQRGLQNGRPRGQFPSANQDVLGLFVQDEIKLGAWTLTPGVRFDRFQQERGGGGNSLDSSRASPRVTLAWQATEWLQPYLSYAEAFRAPSMTELYVGGQHFPGNFFVPNPNLRPETATTYEAGVDLRFRDVLREGDRLRGRVAMFRNNIADFIEQTVRATTTTSANIGQARIEGIEAELQYDSGAWFAGLGAAALRGTNEETGRPLASVPAHRITLNGGHRFQQQGVVLGSRLALTDAQDRLPDSTSYRVTAASAVWDLYASWQPEFAPNLRLDVSANNLLDATYRRSNWNSVPTPAFAEVGRNIRVALRASF